MNIEKKINADFFKTISLEVAITLRGRISEEDITEVWNKLNPPKRKKKAVESDSED